MAGGGGADKIIAGAGNDTIVVTDPTADWGDTITGDATTAGAGSNDVLKINAHPNDVTYTVNIGTNWDKTKTDLTYRGGATVESTSQAEKVNFNQPLDNDIGLSGRGALLIEMARLSNEAYNHRPDGSGGGSATIAIGRWHAVAAMELGIYPARLGAVASDQTLLNDPDWLGDILTGAYRLRGSVCGSTATTLSLG